MRRIHYKSAKGITIGITLILSEDMPIKGNPLDDIA